MKTFVLSVVSIVLVSIFFCHIVMAAPTLPSDVQIVQPDPSLPKELSGFWGKWEGNDGYMDLFFIVEKIDEQKASLYIYRSKETDRSGAGWARYEGKVKKDGKNYKVWYSGPFGTVDLTLKGEYLNVFTANNSFRVRRVR